MALGLFVVRAPAQDKHSNYWRLTGINHHVPADQAGKSGWDNGIIKLIEPIRADASGGSVYVEVTDPGQKPRRYRFSWSFTEKPEEVKDIYLKRPLHIQQKIEGDGAASASEYNPYWMTGMSGRAADDSIPVIGNEVANRFYLKNPDNRSNERMVGVGLDYPDFGFRITLNGLTSAAYSVYLIEYNYTGSETALPPPSSPPQPTPVLPGPLQGVNISGNWLHTKIPNSPDAPTKIIQNGNGVTIINEFNNTYSATWIKADTIFIKDLDGGLQGKVSGDGAQIDWSNGGTWTKATASGQPIVSKMTLKADVWKVKAGGTVTVPVWLLKGDGLTDMNFNVTYEPSVAMADATVGKGNLLDGADFEANGGSAGTVKVGFVPKPGGIASSEGTVALITFKAMGQAGRKTSLTIVPRKSSIAGGAAANVATINGEIVIVGDDGGFPPGDLDGNGTVDMADVLLALKMSVDLIPVNMRADLDKDGSVTAADARIIREKVRTGSNR